MANATLDLALAAAGLDQVTVLHRPRLLTQRLEHHRGRSGRVARGPGDDPHPRRPPPPSDARRKIERWHQTLKNVRRGNDPPDRFLILLTLLENHHLLGALEEQIGAFVERTNHARPHESLGNLTPADVHHGRGEAILAERPRIKRRTRTPGACSTTHAPPKPHPQMDQTLRS